MSTIAEELTKAQHRLHYAMQAERSAREDVEHLTALLDEHTQGFNDMSKVKAFIDNTPAPKPAVSPSGLAPRPLGT